MNMVVLEGKQVILAIMTIRGHVTFQETVAISRPLWWFATCLPFIIGALLADASLGVTFFLGALYFLFPYNLLLYGTNDMFDYDSDEHNVRKNSATHGTTLAKIKQPALRKRIIYTNVPFVLLLMVLGNIESSVFLVMMLYLVLAYSVTGLRYKEIPFIDSLTSAFHYASPFLFALLLFSSPDLWTPAFASFYFWAVGSHAFAAIQDITPDKRAGIKTIATYLGVSKTLIFVVITFGLAAIAPILSYGVYGFIAVGIIVPYVIGVLSTWRYRDNDQALQFVTVWHRFLKLSYVVAIVGSITLLYLYNK